MTHLFFYTLWHSGPFSVFHIAVIRIVTKQTHKLYPYLYILILLFIQLNHFSTVPPRWETLSTKTQSDTILGFLQEEPLSVAFLLFLLSLPMGKHLFFPLLLRAPLCSRESEKKCIRCNYQSLTNLGAFCHFNIQDLNKRKSKSFSLVRTMFFFPFETKWKDPAQEAVLSKPPFINSFALSVTKVLLCSCMAGPVSSRSRWTL